MSLKEFGVHIRTMRHEVRRLLEYAVKLDNLGFDHLKVGDHSLTLNSSVEYPNAHTLLSAMGAITKNIRLSTSVTDPFRRHPVEIAQGVATLDRITNGRAVLGIGAGEMMNLAPFGIDWRRPYTALKEAIDVIKLLWGSTPESPVNYRGRIFNLEHAYLQMRCHQKPHPPIYVGALGPKTRELSGEKSNGWIPATEIPESLKLHLRDVKRGIYKRGGEPEDFVVSATIYTDIGEYEEVFKAVEPTARGVLAMNHQILGMLGHKVEHRDDITIQKIRVNDPEAMKILRERAVSIPRELVEKVVAIGEPDRIISRLEDYIKVGVNSIIICSLSEDDDKIYEAYSEKIMPYLKETYGS